MKPALTLIMFLTLQFLPNDRVKQCLSQTFMAKFWILITHRQLQVTAKHVQWVASESLPSSTCVKLAVIFFPRNKSAKLTEEERVLVLQFSEKCTLIPASVFFFCSFIIAGQAVDCVTFLAVGCSSSEADVTQVLESASDVPTPPRVTQHYLLLGLSFKLLLKDGSRITLFL